jgi:hypothetical protein
MRFLVAVNERLLVPDVHSTSLATRDTVIRRVTPIGGTRYGASAPVIAPRSPWREIAKIYLRMDQGD